MCHDLLGHDHVEVLIRERGLVQVAGDERDVRVRRTRKRDRGGGKIDPDRPTHMGQPFGEPAGPAPEVEDPRVVETERLHQPKDRLAAPGLEAVRLLLATPSLVPILPLFGKGR